MNLLAVGFLLSIGALLGGCGVLILQTMGYMNDTSPDVYEGQFWDLKDVGHIRIAGMPIHAQVHVKAVDCPRIPEGEGFCVPLAALKKHGRILSVLPKELDGIVNEAWPHEQW